MEPVTVVGVAAAAVQFADLAFKITNRIAVFITLSDVSKDAQGPKAFVDSLRNQLRLLRHTIRRIEEGLTNYKDKFRNDEIAELSEYILNLNRHGEKLDELLSQYLPSHDALTSARLLVALKSIATDARIKSVMERIKELHPILTTFLLTSVAFRDGSASGPLDGPMTIAEQGQQRSHFDTIYQVSRHEARHFIERPGLLEEIDRVLQGPDTRIAVLLGMGGQGKTQLALRYCRNARSRSIYDCILWVDASTKESTIRSLEKTSEELNVNNQVLLDADARVAFVKRKLASSTLKWLLVFDNYDHPTAFDLRDYIPSNPLGTVLITSRSTETDRIGRPVHVSGMTESEAIQLLVKQLDAPNDTQSHTAAADIVKRLGYLPLAIDQAGAYMKAECLPLAEFLGHYERSAKDILESAPSLWEYNEPASKRNGEETSATVAKTVFTTWNLSYTLLKPNTSTGALKATVLSLLAFFDHHEISEEYFKTYHSSNAIRGHLDCISLFVDEKGQWSSRKFDSVMREFSRLSLITSHNMERKETKYALVSLHPLVRDWINLRQNADTHRTNFTSFTRILASSFSSKFWVDSHFKYGFRLSVAERRQLATHVNHWMKAFKIHNSNLRPTIIIPESDQVSMVVAAEQQIAFFLEEMCQYENSYAISQWLWDSCDTSNNQMVRIKLFSGAHEVSCLVDMQQREQAKSRAREQFQFWDGMPSGAHYLSFLVLVESLSFSVYSQDKREVINLCEDKLTTLPKEDIRNISKRHHCLISIACAADSTSQEELRDRWLRITLDEAAEYGGNNYGKDIWSIGDWWNVIVLVSDGDDLGLLEQLSLAGVKQAVSKYGLEHTKTLEMILLRADALSRMERFTEAETMVRGCIDKFVNTWRARPLFGKAHEILGIVLSSQGRHEEAYEAFSLALLQIGGPSLDISKMRLIYYCGIAAEYFNVALADAHFTLLLGLSKRTDNWDNIIGKAMSLYRVKDKMGTGTAAQDALDIVIDGLELYGLAVVYPGMTTRGEDPGRVSTILNLDGRQPFQSLAENDSLHESLLRSIGGWRGFELLIRVAIQLLRTRSASADEQAFDLARVTFEKITNLADEDIDDFLTQVFSYKKLRFETDGDKQRIQDIVEWAKLQAGKYEGVMDDFEDYWDDEITELRKLVQSPDNDSGDEHRAKNGVVWQYNGLTLLPTISSVPLENWQKLGKALRRLSNKFSQAKPLRQHGSTSSQPQPSFQHGLKSTESRFRQILRRHTGIEPDST
ncbi:hypothetical protein GGR52DRAFT_573297 [Hypoxylon sp. FL1284]|nr:hypothetical protein GGR52DRAFT_573297 [Hypoxylon sp. FL1284]